MSARGSGQQLRDRGDTSGKLVPAVSVARQELVDATHEWDRALAHWWTYSPEEGAEIAKRWWKARAEFRRVTVGES